jgi:hypothetical protein
MAAAAADVDHGGCATDPEAAHQLDDRRRNLRVPIELERGADVFFEDSFAQGVGELLVGACVRVDLRHHLFVTVGVFKTA